MLGGLGDRGKTFLATTETVEVRFLSIEKKLFLENAAFTRTNDRSRLTSGIPP
jgi:hypothetical protein